MKGYLVLDYFNDHNTWIWEIYSYKHVPIWIHILKYVYIIHTIDSFVVWNQSDVM